MNYLLKSLQDKGKIVYEYNPLRNLQHLEKINGEPPGVPTDFLTKEGDIGLNFDLTHPVDIICQPSYDGSVNLILNDNKNTPKLINTRFSPLQNNTYKIVDRSGEHDTNIYNEKTFNIDTSLYKRIEKIPNISLQGVFTGGSLKVGNYVFYLKYADADDNETDFAAESGIVSCFIGIDASPTSINGGYANQNSLKMVQLKVTNIDDSYDYLKVYYTRAFSDIDENTFKNCFKIVQKYPISGNTTYITITGEEDVDELQISDLNLKYFIASSVKTQAECQNRLYFGNLTQEQVNIPDLSDLCLRIIPYYKVHKSEDIIGKLNAFYKDTSSAPNRYMYYNTKNIYNNVGYWPEEIYRFGIIFIMANGTLSPVFNVLGMQGLCNEDEALALSKDSALDIVDPSTNNRIKLAISEEDYSLIINNSNKYNSKGVVNMPEKWFTEDNKQTLLSINFYIPKEVITYLKETYSIQGWFFVRQKRITNILAQGWSLPMDKEASVPCIYTSKTPKVEGFLNKSKILTHNYQTRLHDGEAQINSCAFICPEFEIHQSYYNMIFTGTEFSVKPIAKSSTGYFSSQTASQRLYGVNQMVDAKNNQIQTVKIAAIPDGAPVVVIDDHRFRSQVGFMEDPLKFRYIGREHKDNDEYKYVRGIYGPYLGVVGSLDYATLYNIYTPGYSPSYMPLYFKTRYEDYSQYSAISDRYIAQNYTQDTEFECFRGDCFQCNFTHKLNRNFCDSTAPTNDIILEANTWKENYDIYNIVKSAKINRGDVNAVKLGSWYTVPVWSTRNISLRATDLSYPQEEGEFGHTRTFYPLSSLSVDGESKLPESNVMNAGFNVTGGERWNFTLPNTPYYKDTFQTRIAYSDLNIDGSFKNNYRVFNETCYRDYPRIYGGLMKLVELKGNLVAVFEHGVCLIAVNERTVAGSGSGGNVFINTDNVLPLNPLVISDMYGSQWADSIIKTPKYIYGVDTVARKIWKTDGQQLMCISDLKMSRFLNSNISLKETEFTPIIGVRNVKTHYNEFKQDVMFTFYDNTKGENEVAWNLCYSEKLDKFITFYSWIPSFSANIDNMFFSFDRDTSKFYTKLSTSVHNNSEAYGVTVLGDGKLPTVIYNKDTKFELHIDDSVLLNYENQYYKFEIKQDPWGFYNYFDIVDNNLVITDYANLWYTAQRNEYFIYLKLKGEVFIKSKQDSSIIKDAVTGNNTNDLLFDTYTNIIALRFINYIETAEGEKSLYELPTTAFYKHGQAGIFDNCEKIKPTFWYGKQHPFEFEVIVNDNPSMHKVFNNLQLLSNKAEPESFHYEVVGQSYDWAWDKKNMYYRQEATKCLLQNLGCNISYDYKYLEELTKSSPNYPEQIKINEEDYNKSTLFPLSYIRKDTLNEIKDSYVYINEVYSNWANFETSGKRDYVHLAGAELVHDDLLNEYKVWNHSPAINMSRYGRLRGNMQYKEDMWDIQINSIIFVQQNETSWKNSVPPIYLVGTLPNDIINLKLGINKDGSIQELAKSEIPQQTYGTGKWSARKETRVRDKYMKVRVRYSGKDLALINAILTDYNVSFA